MTVFQIFFILAHYLISIKAEWIDILQKPIPGIMAAYIRTYAQIPDYNYQPARIVGITHWGDNLFVCTSASGGRIYRVYSNGKADLWFDVQKAMSLKGRSVELHDKYHGGVRSIAFHPNFNKNNRFYVSLVETRYNSQKFYKYLSTSPKTVNADSVVLEWRVFPGTFNVDPNTLREVIRIGIPYYDHPIKQMAFLGPNLYIGHGDGSVQSAITGGGQRNDGLGKIIRINPLPGPNGQRYTIPNDNPYLKNGYYLPELYAVGLRNPHNLCFSRVYGDLFVADAGRDNVEEINIIKPGRNYGWSKREGPFVHLEKGGLGSGIAPLPKYDDGLTYPNIALGHFGERGWGYHQAKQAIAGSCPIENGSDLSNLILYSNFPTDGNLYYSWLPDVRGAIVNGPPWKLTSAPIYKMQIYFNHDGNPKTRPIKVSNLRDIVRFSPGKQYEKRADVRFGQGARGEIYWSSKTSGKIYVIENTFPKV